MLEVSFLEDLWSEKLDISICVFYSSKELEIGCCGENRGQILVNWWILEILDIVCNQVLVIKVLAGESVTLVGFSVSSSWLGFVMYVQNYFEVCYRVFTKTRNLLKLRTMESFTLTRNQIKKIQRIVSGTLDASYQVCVSTRISPKCLHWQKTRTRAALEVVDSHFQCNYQLMTL